MNCRRNRAKLFVTGDRRTWALRRTLAPVAMTRRKVKYFSALKGFASRQGEVMLGRRRRRRRIGGRAEWTLVEPSLRRTENAA